MTIEVINPEEVFKLLQEELPADLLNNIFVAGSLAAAYHYRHQLTTAGVKTKDADLVLHPAGNAAVGATIAMKLMDEGWRPRMFAGFEPGTEATPPDQCPAIRLYPPKHERYFIELLIVPTDGVQGREWQKVKVGDDYYGLPMFEFMALLAHGRQKSDPLEYADSSMMALANLLSHPDLDNDDPMSTPVAGRDIHRSSKDLGRILALAHLTKVAELDEWAGKWLDALKEVFEPRWVELASNVGDGLRKLLADAERFEEAHHTCDDNFLHGLGVTEEQLRATAKRVIKLVIEPVEQAGRKAQTVAT